MNTPWGQSDYSEPFGITGVTFYGTPSHGGYRVTYKAADSMPFALRQLGEDWQGAFWFEEDCAWAAVILAFPDSEQGKRNFHQAKESLINWYPDTYEKFFNVKVEPWQSLKRRDELAYQQQKA